ncbi:hypothetical protein ACFSMW_06705 [Virgibacillus halophilus]|uniref:Uncharacterized protein n=1 Tax=Tigheibacillus halophilus TaxID=361280 RepID=A0ABU5C621_9BACI|nr:hypothetical protein [Virgibacillus halophilus]
MTKPTTKVTGQTKFELVYHIRKKKAEGWKAGKIRYEEKRAKHFRQRGKFTEYAGDSITQQYVCHMWKEDGR